MAAEFPTSPIDEIIADFHQQEEMNPSLAPVEWIHRYPEFQQDLKDYFDDLEGLCPKLREVPCAEKLPMAPPGYHFVRRLGRGGLGQVWEAWDKQVCRSVALKWISDQGNCSREAARRWHYEADAVARLNHPHILPIYQMGEFLELPFFTMPLIVHGSVRQHLPELNQNPKKAIRLMMKVARAIHFAHERGILHRDIKPGNILVEIDPFSAEYLPMVADFGLAYSLKPQQWNPTAAEVVVGTPQYLAPEQFQANPTMLTVATDIWGLGATLYATLTGHPPFQAKDPFQLMNQIVEGEPTLPSKLNPKLPPELDLICLKALEKDPMRRYRTAEAFADDLGNWLHHRPIFAESIGPVGRFRKWVHRHLGLTL